MLRRLPLVFSLLLVLTLLAACGEPDEDAGLDAGDVVDAEPTSTRAAAAYLAPTPEVEPVRFPEDEAPHDMLSEWWYYTGHMFTEDGARYGFEYVIFQAQRGAFPTAYAAHFAITDAASNTFVYDQKIGGDAIVPGGEGFNLNLDGWEMRGALGTDELKAAMDGYAIDLTLTSTKPPALHNGVGYVGFGPAGGSYYYSRTRMEIDGTLTVGDQPLAVTGEAWMDHQWGNFISVGAGGWDWFSAQLDNGEDLTISLIRDINNEVVMSYGTLVREDGEAVHLEMGDFNVDVLDEWTSPHTGATYPAEWRVSVLSEDLTITLTPSMNDQELRTQASTGVTYWEGEVLVEGTRGDEPVSGLGYVELTGYADGGSLAPEPTEP